MQADERAALGPPPRARSAFGQEQKTADEAHVRERGERQGNIDRLSRERGDHMPSGSRTTERAKRSSTPLRTCSIRPTTAADGQAHTARRRRSCACAQTSPTEPSTRRPTKRPAAFLIPASHPSTSRLDSSALTAQHCALRGTWTIIADGVERDGLTIAGEIVAEWDRWLAEQGLWPSL